MSEVQKLLNVEPCDCGCTSRIVKGKSEFLPDLVDACCTRCGACYLILASSLPCAEMIIATLRDWHLLPVVERIAAQHHVTVAELVGKVRSRSLVAARHEVWHELRRPPFKLSYPRIAQLFNVDHSSVMHGVRKIGGRPLKQLGLPEVA